MLKDFSALIAAAWRRAAKVLHSRGWSASGVNPDILTDPDVMPLIEATAGVLDSAIEQAPMSEAMRSSLQRSNFIFSGLKTFHELNEAFPSLIDKEGNLKPFERFLTDVQSIDRTYNRNYLRAEYNFAVASAQSAARWEEFEAGGDRYDLQYRTAGDGRVRPEHAALDKVTLPVSSPFWDSFMPPNGWNCRCSVVQVRKGKYPVTDLARALELGGEATARDKRGMLRFNPGKERSTWPKYNPYTIRQCRNCDIASGKAKLSFEPSSNMCQGCEIIHRCYNDLAKSRSRVLRDHYMHQMEPLLNKSVVVSGNGHPMQVGFRTYGNRHLYSDTFTKYATLKKEDLSGIDKILERATFLKKVKKYKPRKDRINRFYVYQAELRGKTIYLHVAEELYITPKGKRRFNRYLYSVKDKLVGAKNVD